MRISSVCAGVRCLTAARKRLTSHQIMKIKPSKLVAAILAGATLAGCAASRRLSERDQPARFHPSPEQLQSAESGDAEACCLLGWRYLSDRNYTEAAKWLLKSGNINSTGAAGQLLVEGRGVAQNLPRGIKCLLDPRRPAIASFTTNGVEANFTNGGEQNFPISAGTKNARLIWPGYTRKENSCRATIVRPTIFLESVLRNAGTQNEAWRHVRSLSHTKEPSERD